MKAHLLFLSPLCLVAFAGPAFADDAPRSSRPAASEEAPPTADGAQPMSAQGTQPTQVEPSALAQAARPAQPAQPPPPTIDLSTAPVAPPVQRKYHFHEGFYLRASLGFGDYRASFNDANRSNQDFSEHGSSMSIDLLIGGSPSPGVSIGGGLLLEPLFGADYKRNGMGLGSHGGFSTLIGPFIDGFPDPTKGWHLGGLIGIAAQSFQNVNDTGSDSHRAAGIGGAAWFGYDFWVADEWAIGPQLRLMGMRTSDTHSGEDVSAFARSFTFGLGAVFN